MDPIRLLARPLMAGIFVYSGLDAVRNPGPKVPLAEDVAQAIAHASPVELPSRTDQLVRLNGAVQIGAGVLLGSGRFPRIAALALAAGLIPTTLAGHRFWEANDDVRNQQTIQFLKNAAMFGGLVMTALDSGGRASIPWRTKHAARQVEYAVADRAKRVLDATKAALPTT